MAYQNIPAEKLVNGAQALVPFYPRPTPEQIDDILARLCKAFGVPFTVESDAKLIWRQRVGDRRAPVPGGCRRGATFHIRRTSHD
jgi:hypothetical protein